MQPQSGRPDFVPLLVLTALLIGWAVKTAPVVGHGELRLYPALVAGLAVLTSFMLLQACLSHCAQMIEWWGARKGTGKSGTAKWGRYADFKQVLSASDQSPFWGLSAKEKTKLSISFDSHAYVVGPTRSGKGHTVVVPLIFLIPHSKIIIDYKPELWFICRKGLRQLGQEVIEIDPFGLYKKAGGQSHSINLLDVVTNNLYELNGLRRVFGLAGELTMQLYKDPPDGSTTDPFWPNGTRKILSMAIISICMMKGREGVISDVALLLDDPAGLEAHLCSIVGIDHEGKPDEHGAYLFELSDWALHHDEDDLAQFLNVLRRKAFGVLTLKQEAGKTFGSFLEGAQQALAPFGFTEIAKVFGKTSFDFDAIKSGDTILNIFVAGDASRPDETQKFIEASQWWMQHFLKRHPNKHVPVSLLYDEVNNYAPFGFIDLFSWSAGLHIHVIIFLQNFSAFEKKHGKHAESIIDSECEIKLFLPGQRSKSSIDKILYLLGEQSVMDASLAADKDGSGLNETLRESGRKLMTSDEIRRSENGLLFVQNLPVIEQRPVSYSEIDPLRDLADINPYHNKPFRQKVKVKLKLPLKKETNDEQL